MRAPADREAKSGMDFLVFWVLDSCALTGTQPQKAQLLLLDSVFLARRVAFKCAATPGVTIGTSDSILPVLGAASLLRAELRRKGPGF